MSKLKLAGTSESTGASACNDLEKLKAITTSLCNSQTNKQNEVSSLSRAVSSLSVQGSSKCIHMATASRGAHRALYRGLSFMCCQGLGFARRTAEVALGSHHQNPQREGEP